MNHLSNETLIEGIKSGDKRLLGKAITLVESKNPAHRLQADLLLKEVLPYTGNSVRIGITGVPGAGKSTFIESFGLLAITQGKKVAVLAVDPSSAVNKGSILGDKTRMEDLARSENAFIRPSPTSGFLGGVANSTFEAMLLCEAAGYDLILIETVGVGQSEILVSDITDVFVFLKIMGGGDELQGIKRGIMEMIDLVFINKVNEQNIQQAKNAKVELLRALHFMPSKEKDWKIPVILGSALYNSGLEEIYAGIQKFVSLKIKNNTFHSTRKAQFEKRFEYWTHLYLLQKLNEDNQMEESYINHKKNASEMIVNPSSEARLLVEQLFNKK